jgi:pimeloyl-ACP methyl ester carboxylesterase
MKKFKQLLVVKSIGLYINFLSYFNSKAATSLAYKIFCLPQKGKFKQGTIPTMLLETKQEELQYNALQFKSYIWQGNDTIILLLHGWESNVLRWKKILPHLKNTGATIIAIDAPAHGYCDGNEFNAILYAEFVYVAAKKYNPTVLIGHSVGGMAAIYYQKKYQNKNVKKIVSLGAPSELRIVTAAYYDFLGLNKKTIRLMEHFVFEKFGFHVAEFATHLFAEKIETELLIVHDKKDKTISFQEGIKIAKAAKKSTFIKTDNLGHSLQNDNLYVKIVHFLK